jgi:hypothetical protein
MLVGFLAGAALLASGCFSRPRLSQVEGVVCCEGEPLPNILVQFLPDSAQETGGPRSSAVTDAEGRFRLMLDDQREGAVVGRHRVTLYDLEAREATEGRRPPPSRVPPRYSGALSTPLQCQVEPGPQTIPIDVPRE